MIKTCSACKGTGDEWAQTGEGEVNREVCENCDGTGEELTVDWKAFEAEPCKCGHIRGTHVTLSGYCNSFDKSVLKWCKCRYFIEPQKEAA